MKSLLILILTVALLGGAALSRPTENDFKSFVKHQAEATQSSFLGKFGVDVWADNYIKSCTFKNDVVCTVVQKDGKTIYTGVFSHWWGNDIKPQ